MTRPPLFSCSPASCDSSRGVYCGSKVTRLYALRSWTHPVKSASVILFGKLKTGCAGARILTGAFSSTTRAMLPAAHDISEAYGNRFEIENAHPRLGRCVVAMCLNMRIGHDIHSVLCGQFGNERNRADLVSSSFCIGWNRHVNRDTDLFGTSLKR